MHEGNCHIILVLQRVLDTETPFKKIMAANRGEIAVRITRAGLELGLQTVRNISKYNILINLTSINDHISQSDNFVRSEYCSLPFTAQLIGYSHTVSRQMSRIRLGQKI